MSDYRGINLIQDPDRKAWNKRGGWTITRPFRGEQGQIEAAAAAAYAAGDSFEINPGPDGGPWELLIIYGAEETQSPNEPLSDTWELDGNTLEKELWELPFIRDEFNSIRDNRAGNPTGDPRLVSQACINWIRRNIEAWIRGDSKTITLDPEERDLTYAELRQNVLAYGFHEPAFNRLIHLLARGVKAFPVSQFVLRRTRIIANNFNVNNLKEIYSPVFKRWSTSTLKQREGIPSNIRFVLPEGEWVKQTPDIKQTTASKWTVTEEWWHADLWEEEIYGKLNERR